MEEVAPQSDNVVRIPVDPQARLRAALRMLETRLDQQQASLAAWHASMATLRDVMARLQDNAEACLRDIDGLAGRAAVARALATDLDRNADRLLEVSRASCR